MERFHHNGREYMTDGTSCWLVLRDGDVRDVDTEWRSAGMPEWKDEDPSMHGFVLYRHQYPGTEFRKHCEDPRKNGCHFKPGDRVRIVGEFSGGDSWRNSHRGEVIEIDKLQSMNDIAYASPANGESRANLYLWPLSSLEPVDKPVDPDKPSPLRKPFYMVKGNGPANFRHDTRDSAIKEASRLAEIHGGQEFHVLVSICTVKSAGVEIAKHEIVSTADDSDVPF